MYCHSCKINVAPAVVVYKNGSSFKSCPRCGGGLNPKKSKHPLYKISKRDSYTGGRLSR